MTITTTQATTGVGAGTAGAMGITGIMAATTPVTGKATGEGTGATTGATVYTILDSPLGELLLVGTESATAPGGTALVSLSLPDQKGAATVQDGWRRDSTAFVEICAQLTAYFAGSLTRFDIAYADSGTDFQRRVWQALDGIPYGTTTTYGEIARLIGVSGAGVRAVGTAIGRNPLLVVRPCHRVIGSDGALRGYAAGVDRKEHLLGLEGAPVR